MNNRCNILATPDVLVKFFRYFTLILAGLYFLYTAIFGFMYPVCGDDYMHSKIAREGQTAAYVTDLYMNWSLRIGNIMSVLVLHDGKIIIDLINPFVQILLPLCAFYLLFSHFPRLKTVEDCVSCIILLLLFWIGCARPRDTVYWVSGATVYTWGMLFILLFSCGLKKILSIRNGEQRMALLVNIAILPLGFLAGYSTENTSLTGVVVLIGIWMFFHLRKEDINRGFYYAFAGFVAGTLLMVTAPGMWMRNNVAAEGVAFFDIYGKIRLLPSIIAFWIYSSYLCFAVILVGLPCLSVFFIMKRDRNVSLIANIFNNSRLLMLLVLLLTSLLLVLVFCGAGVLPAVRAYYSSSVLLAMSAVLTMDLLIRKYHARRIVFCVVAVLVCYSAIILFQGARDFITIRKDHNQREVDISGQKMNGVKDLIVSQHRIVRNCLFQFIWIEDIVGDKDFWLNRHAAAYYRVDSIRCSAEVKPDLFYWGAK